MPRKSAYNRLSTYATTITQEGADTLITYHKTVIVRFNAQRVVLDNGGWITVTTARKMNQASHQFGLGYSVSLTGGKRVRYSNNLLHKAQNPTGAETDTENA